MGCRDFVANVLKLFDVEDPTKMASLIKKYNSYKDQVNCSFSNESKQLDFQEDTFNQMFSSYFDTADFNSFQNVDLNGSIISSKKTDASDVEMEYQEASFSENSDFLIFDNLEEYSDYVMVRDSLYNKDPIIDEQRENVIEYSEVKDSASDSGMSVPEDCEKLYKMNDDELCFPKGLDQIHTPIPLFDQKSSSNSPVNIDYRALLTNISLKYKHKGEAFTTIEKDLNRLKFGLANEKRDIIIPMVRNVLYLFEFKNLSSTQDYTYIQGNDGFALAVASAFFRFGISDLNVIEACTFLMYTYSMSQLNYILDMNNLMEIQGKLFDMLISNIQANREVDDEIYDKIQSVFPSFYIAWINSLFVRSLFIYNEDLWFNLFNNYFFNNSSNISYDLINFSSNFLIYFGDKLYDLAVEDEDLCQLKQFCNEKVFQEITASDVNEIIRMCSKIHI